MAIPDFQSLMLPVLKKFADGKEKTQADVRGPVAQEFELSDEDLAVLLPSGRQSSFNNRVSWAMGYLKQARLLESPRRGVYRLASRGEEVLKDPPERIGIEFLDKYPEFVAFRTPAEAAAVKKEDPAIAKTFQEGLRPVAAPSTLTPDEQIRSGFVRLNASLAAQVLERVKQGSPAFFEQLVVDLLVAMGYGGSHEDAARVVGKSGDGGIDGVIKEDRLGLESIYVQAKRWEASVGRPIIQQFAGAMDGKHATKGVVFSTGGFSAEAVRYAESHPKTIVLVDGQRLAELMIEFGVGVSEVETIKLKRVDEDYFGEE